MKEYVLVLWSESKESSVIKDSDIRIGKDLVTKGKWGEKWYPIEIIKKHENKDYLESLTVTVDGQMLTPDKRNSVSPDLLLSKRQNKEKIRHDNASKKKTLQKENSKLLSTQSIFATTSSYTSSRVQQRNVSDDDSAYENSNVTQIKKEDNRNVACNLEKRLSSTCICEKLQPMTEEDVEKLNKIIDIMRSITLPRIPLKATSTSLFSKNQTINETDMELTPKSKVFVNRSKVNFFTIQWKKKPRELARRLLKLIMGEDALKKHSATGKNWPAIPENIYTAVFEYINAKAPKKKYTLEPSEYREVVTALCATLRNPKKEYRKVKHLQEKNARVDKNFATDDDDEKNDSNDKKNICGEKILDDSSEHDEEEKENEGKLISESDEDSTRIRENLINKRKIINAEQIRSKLKSEYLQKLKELDSQCFTEFENERFATEKRAKLN